MLRVMRSPGAERANEGVEGRREQEPEGGDPKHPEEHGGAEGLAHLRACPGRHGEREDTEDEGEGGHQDRTKTRPCGGRRGLLGLIALHVLSLRANSTIRIAFFAAKPTSTTKPI